MYQYAHIDAKVMKKFDEIRKRKRRVSFRGLIAEYRQQLKIEVGEDRARSWKASSSWRSRFYKRNNISLRKKTNNHSLSWEAREPRLKRYLASLERRIKDAGDRRFPVHKRLSLDQV